MERDGLQSQTIRVTGEHSGILMRSCAQRWEDREERLEFCGCPLLVTVLIIKERRSNYPV